MIEFNLMPLAYDQVKTNEWLPDLQPYAYQWRAFQLIGEALEQQQTLCLFLVTPTGSGKTLTAFAQSILTGEPMIGAYPTNELLADQARALQPQYVVTHSNEVVSIDSAALDRMQAEYDMTRHSETLEIQLRHKPVLLTNPDILFYVAFGLYPKLPGLPERLWALMGSYRLFAFDEFHLYNIKQQADIAFVVGALNAINSHYGRVFVFASATPDLEMVALLREQLHLRVEVIEAQPSAIPAARIVAHPLQLTLAPANLDRWQGLTAIEENHGLIDMWRQQYPAGRWVTILDSVAGAIMMAQRFRVDFGQAAVGEVHGLSSLKMRAEALAKPATVGTSTIEVGVDFKDAFEKDFLLFEARTSSQFLQRLGRLGRHAKSLPIPNRAIALVPDHVHNFMREKMGGITEITRAQLRTLIEEAYRQPETFNRFLHKHAAVEMAEASNLALGMFQPDDRPRIEAGFNEVIKALTGRTLQQAFGQRRRYQDDGILAPLLTFRGAGLEAALLDERGDDSGFPAKTYDVTFLLRRGEYQELSVESFQSELEHLRLARPDWSDEVMRAQRSSKLIEGAPDKLLGAFGFFKLTQLLDKPRRLWFEIDQEAVLGKKGCVTVIEGLTLETEPHAPMRLLNKVLERKRIVAWMIDSPPNTIKFGRALPPLFAVYELHINRLGGNAIARPWSIAFNQDAFFLDSLWWSSNQNDDAIIV